jgi:hypothetical protein
MIAAVIVPLSVAEHSGTPLCWCTAWHATIAEHHARGLSCRALGTHNSLVCVCVCVPDVSHALPTDRPECVCRGRHRQPGPVRPLLHQIDNMLCHQICSHA